MINVGVIGLGNMGQHHAKAYTSLNEVCFVAACDSDKARFDSIKKKMVLNILSQSATC